MKQLPEREKIPDNVDTVNASEAETELSDNRACNSLEKVSIVLKNYYFE